jgi:tetratricopeptide (TPR) repeat protein
MKTFDTNADFGEAARCVSLEEVTQLLRRLYLDDSGRQAAAAYGMSLVAAEGARPGTYRDDALKVLDRLARAKAEMDIAVLHLPPVIEVTAYLLLAAQRYVDEQTIPCTEWPTTEDIAAFVSQEARKFAKPGHAQRPSAASQPQAPRERAESAQAVPIPLVLGNIIAPPAADAFTILSKVEDHLEIYRAQARSQPEARLLSRAPVETLLELCRKLIELGRPEEVPRVAKEMAAVEGALARLDPDTYQRGIPLSLSWLSKRLQDKARLEEALKVMEDAVQLSREFVGYNQEKCHRDFTRGLAELSNLLNASGRPEEALRAMEEAVEFYRPLVSHRPGHFEPFLAERLEGLGKLLRGLGRPGEALKAMREAVELYRGGGPSVQLQESLETLGKLLNEVGQPEEALKTAEEGQKVRETLIQRAYEEEEAARRAGVPQWVR